MILTVDIGNSRIKWALWHEDAIIDRAAAAYELENCATIFDQLFSDMEQSSDARDERFSREVLTEIFAICVAGNEVSQLFDSWVRQRWQLDVEYLKTGKRFKDVTNAYDDPDQHGVDRWACVVAAHQLFPDVPVCVIGAGTAITFDMIKKTGQHMGGYILPSYTAMRSALLAGTANVVSEYDSEFKKQDVPNNTSEAVNQGLHILLQAGVREFCQRAQDALRDEPDALEAPVQIIITGGFAQTILSYPDIPVMRHEPDLVMQGLYSIMKQRKA